MTTTRTPIESQLLLHSPSIRQPLARASAMRRVALLPRHPARILVVSVVDAEAAAVVSRAMTKVRLSGPAL